MAAATTMDTTKPIRNNLLLGRRRGVPVTGTPLGMIVGYPEAVVRQSGCRPSGGNGFAWHPVAIRCRVLTRRGGGWDDGGWPSMDRLGLDIDSGRVAPAL